jgi:hypothetical protein
LAGACVTHRRLTDEPRQAAGPGPDVIRSRRECHCDRLDALQDRAALRVGIGNGVQIAYGCLANVPNARFAVSR